MIPATPILSRLARAPVKGTLLALLAKDVNCGVSANLFQTHHLQRSKNAHNRQGKLEIN